VDTSILLAWWRVVRTATLVIGTLLSVVAVVEVMRVYVILHAFSPWLGLGFVLVVITGLAWLVGRFVVALWSLPRAPAPPEIVDPTRLSPTEALASAGFLQHRIAQLQQNPALEASQRESLEAVLTRLRQSVDREVVSQSQVEINRLLAPLDEAAERIVQECVRDVMIAVVLSPFRSADLLVVLYRNGQMILRLAQLYQTRPAPVEQLRIVRDVLAVVATVNLLNFTEKFVEQLVERVPLLGQLAGDVTQGVGAGLLTSATGHAALYRCKSIDPWSRPVAQDRLAHRMSSFAQDVQAILKADVLPKLRPRLPDFKSVTERLSAAFEATVEGMGDWVWRPVTTRGSTFAEATIRTSVHAWRGIHTGTKGIGTRSKSLLTQGQARLFRLRNREDSLSAPAAGASRRRFWGLRKKAPGQDHASS
jgi:uncharacterized membrane protein YcjF (UPF0283 family)